MERKKCISCGKYLIAQNGLYFHPDTPCSGLSDYIDIEATIADDFLHKKFEEAYGKPEIDDYDFLNRIYANPILRFLIKVLIKKTKK